MLIRNIITKMTPQELLFQGKGWNYVDVPYGMNSSIGKLCNKDCIIAYYKIDCLTYLLMKNTKKNGYLYYRIVHFDDMRYCKWSRTHGEILSINKVNFNKKWKVVDKPEFDNIKKWALVECIKDDKGQLEEN